jgi:hypothetical protein
VIGDQVDGAIVVDDHDAAAGATMRVRIPALPPDRQHVLVHIPAGTANKTVLVLPGAGFGSPPGDLRIQVLVRAPAGGPRPEPPPRRPPGRAPGAPVPPGRGRPRNPAVARLTGLLLAVVILIFAALLGLGPGLLIGGIMGATSPGPAVPTCNGRVMSQTDQCEVTANGTFNVYDYSQMLAQDRHDHNVGVGVQIAAGVVCSCLLVALTVIMFLRPWRRQVPG